MLSRQHEGMHIVWVCMPQFPPPRALRQIKEDKVLKNLGKEEEDQLLVPEQLKRGLEP